MSVQCEHAIPGYAVDSPDMGGIEEKIIRGLRGSMCQPTERPIELSCIFEPPPRIEIPLQESRDSAIRYDG